MTAFDSIEAKLTLLEAEFEESVEHVQGLLDPLDEDTMDRMVEAAREADAPTEEAVSAYFNHAADGLSVEESIAAIRDGDLGE